MAALTLDYAVALSEVKSRIATVNLSDSQIGRRLNWAIQEISNFFRLETLTRLVTLTTDTNGSANLSVAAVPLDAEILSATWAATGDKLEPLTLGTYSRYQALQRTGPPENFIRLQNYPAGLPYIVVLPRAAGDVDLVVRMAPEEWTTGACPLPSRFFRAIVAGASYFCLSDLNEDEKAGIAKRQYDQAVQILRDREAEEFIHSNQGVSVVHEWPIR